jgi:protein involved in polysaccharide export with SLBB domain
MVQAIACKTHGIQGLAKVLVCGVALACTPLYVSAQDLPPINPDALNELVAELREYPPPALDIRPGTGLRDLGQDLKKAPAKAEERREIGRDITIDDATPVDEKDLIDTPPNRESRRNGSRELRLDGLAPLEARYSRRAGQRLEQFGYDIFTGVDARSPAASTVSDTYVLGPRDKVLVVLRGAQNRTERYSIGDDGQLLVADLRPISAAGRSLREVAREVEQEVASRLLDTQAFVSLDGLRNLNVQILGEVSRPGRTVVSAYGSVLDALNAARGVRKTGSLRRIQLSRADGTQQTVDLYQLLLTGSREVDLQLKDGDRLMVPPVGSTLAVAGPVKRAGIYELPRDQDLTLQQALYLAGETRQAAGLRFMRIRTDNNGNEQFLSLPDGEAAILADQDVVVAQSRGEAPRQVVRVMGSVHTAGNLPIDEARTLSALLGDGANLDDNTYPLLGLIERQDPTTRGKEFVPFKPAAVLAGKENPRLQEGDKVKLFSEDEIMQLASVPQGKAISKAGMFDSGDGGEAAREKLSPTQRVVQDHSVTLNGAVARPGVYPVAANATLDEVLGAAGGLLPGADKSSVEVVTAREDDFGRRAPQRDSYDLTRENPRSILVPVGASVRINPKAQTIQHGGVRIVGEVARPGKYDIMRGEKLSSLLARAGGLTDEAYASGTVFMRASARRQEAAQFRNAAQQLEQSLARALTREDKEKINVDQVDMARQLANELRNAPAVGRVTVEADPDVLRLKPELDVLLEPGDEIVVPPRRQTVAVMGEVHAPANLQFVSGKDAAKYLREAGGFTRFADEGHAFVIGPNGAARPLRASAWNHEAGDIVPGSTIVVPRDPDHYDTLQMVSGIGNILSQLALSAAAIESIDNDN